jgi:hypothetical protein
LAKSKSTTACQLAAQHSDGAIPPSAVELLIAARIATVRQEAAAELASACAESMRADNSAILPPTAKERAAMGFVAWVHSRQPDFFANAPALNGGCHCLARRAYEKRLAAYGQAWTKQLDGNVRCRRERLK